MIFWLLLRGRKSHPINYFFHQVRRTKILKEIRLHKRLSKHPIQISIHKLLVRMHLKQSAKHEFGCNLSCPNEFRGASFWSFS